MSRRRKLEKFARLLKYQHVYEMIDPGSELLRRSIDEVVAMKGQWRSTAFRGSGPLCLELACGRGEYTLALARLHPENNYLGVDIKGARIYQGATKALEENLGNVAFLRIRIEKIHQFFQKGEIDQIWITFPDPFPSKPNRRLTSKYFLDIYDDLLAPSSSIYLKTDDEELYQYSVETGNKHSKYRIIEQSDNISDIRQFRPELNICTYYENLHSAKKKTIKYLHLEKID